MWTWLRLVVLEDTEEEEVVDAAPLLPLLAHPMVEEEATVEVSADAALLLPLVVTTEAMVVA